MSKVLTATDWRAVERKDGSIYFTCGDPNKGYHMAFDSLDANFEGDLELAQRIVTALNRYNEQEQAPLLAHL